MATVTTVEGDREELVKLVGAVENVVTEYRSFYNDGTKAAVMRARKALQEVKVLAAAMRKTIQADKAALKKV